MDIFWNHTMLGYSVTGTMSNSLKYIQPNTRATLHPYSMSLVPRGYTIKFCMGKSHPEVLFLTLKHTISFFVF